jgi:hypothetical protein
MRAQVLLAWASSVMQQQAEEAEQQEENILQWQQDVLKLYM